MRYLGGKYRLAKQLSETMLRYRQPCHDAFVEPFMGGGAISSAMAPHFPYVLLSDIHPDLVMMWQAVQQGWIPPDDVDETLYQSLRYAEPSALRGFVGFGCSFAGKWFGGFGRRAPAGDRYWAAETTTAPAAVRSIMRQAPRIAHANIRLRDYRSVEFTRTTIIYADPPYAGTTGYSQGAFDHAEFWATAERWVAGGATVFVSEQRAPQGWVSVWTKKMPNYAKGDAQTAGARTEHLFMSHR
jgi:DNA adenine methylase